MAKTVWRQSGHQKGQRVRKLVSRLFRMDYQLSKSVLSGYITQGDLSFAYRRAQNSQKRLKMAKHEFRYA